MAGTYNFVDFNLFYLRYSHSFTAHLPVIQIWCQTGHIRHIGSVSGRYIKKPEASLVFRLLFLNQNFVSRTFQPLQAYSPSKTKFFYVSMFRWMETLFIGLAFLKTWSMVLCVTLLLQGLEKAGFGPSQQKAFYWQESEVLITICYLARIWTRLSYTEREKGAFDRAEGAWVSRSSQTSLSSSVFIVLN